MSQSPKLKLASIAVIASLYFSSDVFADNDPGAFILSFARRTDAILDANGAGSASSDRFRTLLREGVDLTGALQLILGKIWDRADTSQRGEIRQAFEDYLVTLFGSRFTGFRGHYPEVRQTRMLPNGEASVMTDVPIIDSGSVRVEWLLAPIGRTGAGGDQNAWRIINVSLAGIDAAVLFRDSFASTLKSGGLGELIKSLEAKSHQ
jgi:ABC-type transporter MlaC component